ncbi:8138_t:CDS:2 [Funneliformis mosseae]|uniref:8138_t:CDS:1 n=1 Tax=Funneliformis mosseae TaxID=27381 RepID=A0A9N9BCM2_FUNMO|nr:8138_t:CDS:2 [Funneliformis mosseae]
MYISAEYFTGVQLGSIIKLMCIVQPEQNLIASIFSDWNNFNVLQKATLYAFTSLFHGNKAADDRNAMFYETIQPYDNVEWSKIINHLYDKLPDNIEFLQEFYFEKASKYYTIRIKRLLDRERLGNEFNDSVIFVAKVFMKYKLSIVPES